MPFDERTRVLLGDAGADCLAKARICVYGLGGVGAAAAMDLVRVGVGRLVVMDYDTIQESNLNRLYFGYTSSVGRAKTEVFIEAALGVNPGILIESQDTLIRGAEAAGSIPEGCDYYLDCIDTLNPKVNLLAGLLGSGLPFASSMGTAGRLAPERLKTGSLWDSSGCPLAQRVRQRLRRLGFGPDSGHTVLCVWSDEPPVAPALPADGKLPGQVINGVRIRAVQGSGPFVPQAAGHLLASLAIRAILGRQ